MNRKTEPIKIPHEDMERLRHAAAAMSAVICEGMEAIVEALTAIFDSVGMSAEEISDHIRTLAEAAEAIQKVEELPERPRPRPPRQPRKDMALACKYMIPRPKPRARSSIPHKGNRRRA